MEEPGLSGNGAVTILDVLGVNICRRAILDRVPLVYIMRSERVSRRWQHIVLNYLQNCRNLTLEVDRYSKIDGHRTVKICTRDNYALPIFRKTIEKLGSLIVRFITNVKDERFYESVALNCPHIRHVELNYFMTDISEKSMSDLIRHKDLETIKISGVKNLKGNFLNALESDNLKSLIINWCPYSRFESLPSADWRLRNVTNLQYISNEETPYWVLPSLLNKMPKLENLSCSVRNVTNFDSFSRQFQSVYCFNNLKRLNISSYCMNRSLLEGLAGCSKLEYLNISGCSSYCRQGLEALIRRPSVTWLCFGFIKNVPYERLRILSFFWGLERWSNYVTPEMLKEASLASRGQKHALEFIVNYPVKEEYSELKIVLDECYEYR